jgi:arginase
MTRSRFTVVGVPSSAGAHHAGQEAAPAALRAAGLVERLSASGADVVDEGDVAGEVFAVDHENLAQRNLAAVVRVARATADATERVLLNGRVALMLGGDCTITLGVVAGAQRVHPNVGLAYLDGDADLTTPATTTSGILDSMGVAHLIGSADTELARLDRPAPILADERLVMLGYDASDLDSFKPAELAVRPGVLHFPDQALLDDAENVARGALEALGAYSSHVIVHFDVDAVTSGDLPLGNFPHYRSGVPLATAATVLRILCSAPQLVGVVLTEVNPGHDPSGQQLKRYVEAVVTALVP